ncbi:MAG: SAM-dependent methyltransferase [Bacilli bacterium]|nr:SAM-dependent methyltransferase [Bacilli bacterium]
MSNLSKRLKTIIEFLNKEDSVVDVGCDHGLLSIYIKENEIVKKVIASDVNPNALASAIKNINEANIDIQTVLSDGIRDVDLSGINTLVIAGMGTSTIKHILADTDKLKHINKIVTQSNNDHEMLRSFMNDIGYYLSNELYIFDKGKWYVTSCFVKDTKKNSKSVLKYGLLNNNEYNKYLIQSKETILDKIPLSSVEARDSLIKEIEDLKRTICK